MVPDVFPTGPITPVTGERGIGDASRLVRVNARDAQAGTPSQELALGFRHDDLTARILLRDWTGAQPDVATIEAQISCSPVPLVPHSNRATCWRTGTSF